jgi:hypothetical protein
VMPVSEGPLSTSIALKRRRGNSLSSPLSSPRERHTYAQLSPVTNSSSAPVNPPPSASTAFSPSSSSSSSSSSPYSVGARSSIENSPRTALRNTLARHHFRNEQQQQRFTDCHRLCVEEHSCIALCGPGKLGDQRRGYVLPPCVLETVRTFLSLTCFLFQQMCHSS